MSSPSRSPSKSPRKSKRSSSKHQYDSDDSDTNQHYDSARGAGGQARDFRNAIEKTVAKELGTSKVQPAELKSWLKEAFDDPSSIDKSDFVTTAKLWKACASYQLFKTELKQIYHTIDKSSGGFSTITTSNILKYISFGDSKLNSKHDDSDSDSDDDDDAMDKGVWGSSPIVDVQLSSSEIEEAKLQKDGYVKVTFTGSSIPANLNEGKRRQATRIRKQATRMQRLATPMHADSRFVTLC